MAGGSEEKALSSCRAKSAGGGRARTKSFKSLGLTDTKLVSALTERQRVMLAALLGAKTANDSEGLPIQYLLRPIPCGIGAPEGR